MIERLSFCIMISDWSAPQKFVYISYMQQSFFLREVLNGISVRKDRQQNCKVSTKKLNN